MRKREIVINNFLGGISWGLGATVGLAVVLALLTILLHWINVVPVIGSFVSEVIKVVEQKNPQLR